MEIMKGKRKVCNICNKGIVSKYFVVWNSKMYGKNAFVPCVDTRETLKQFEILYKRGHKPKVVVTAKRKSLLKSRTKKLLETNKELNMHLTKRSIIYELY